MAGNSENINVDHEEESSPLLFEEETEKNQPAPIDDDKSPPPVQTAHVLPLTHRAVVVGHPVGRDQWDSGLFCCLGRNDQFCSSDLEVCVLGSVASCVLHGMNAERLTSDRREFAFQCVHYSCLYVIGYASNGWNTLAPLLAARNRTAMRRKFNLQGGCEAFQSSCGCCKSMGKEEQEGCEGFCDFCTHVFFHPCALCQEGREVRRRLPHPALDAQVAQPVLVMVPPGGQGMGRE